MNEGLYRRIKVDYDEDSVVDDDDDAAYRQEVVDENGDEEKTKKGFRTKNGAEIEIERLRGGEAGERGDSPSYI